MSWTHPKELYGLEYDWNSYRAGPMDDDSVTRSIPYFEELSKHYDVRVLPDGGEESSGVMLSVRSGRWVIELYFSKDEDFMARVPILFSEEELVFEPISEGWLDKVNEWAAMP